MLKGVDASPAETQQAEPMPLRLLLERHAKPPCRTSAPTTPVAEPALDLKGRPGWLGILARLNVPDELAEDYQKRAIANGTSLKDEIIAAGRISEASLYGEFARAYGLAFAARIRSANLIMRAPQRLAYLAQERGWQNALMVMSDGSTRLLFAPEEPDFERLAENLATNPAIRARICIVAPSQLRAAVIEQSGRHLSREAHSGLAERSPECSARHVISAWQAAVFGIVVGAVPITVALSGNVAITALHIVMSVFFLSCVVLRICAMMAAAPLRVKRPGDFDTSAMPRYDVLVALYREANMVPQLLLALGKLQWPRSKLSIKLVCEADDHETLNVLKAHQLHPCVEIIEVPPEGPRTKPKALAYALQLCTGELLALYDAEDLPDRHQLIEAWQRFEQGGENLACVQAPLVVANLRKGMVARMFGFEYSGLFRGILPWLSRMKLMFPLGGTSNHFRRSALVAAGGWDPYNVTEDADLGLRLTRMGFDTATISLPTFEDAPEDLKTWLPQRVRWFKGWLQTWLVHMRSPLALARDLGAGSFLVSQVLFLGLILSALVHPIFLATMVYIGARMMFLGPVGPYENAILVIDIINISLGYAAFIILSALTLARNEKFALWKVALFTPVYWLMLSLAAWLAIIEIMRKPHHWNKTAHKTRSLRSRPSASPDPASFPAIR
jgi:cellulose synthase/poly-beta-1,6-N-acetylglucosamine synthase-like glycosyltransferase